MLEMLEQILQFLQENQLDSSLISLILSIVGVIICFVKTGKNAILKKLSSSNSINLDDYVLIIGNILYSFNSSDIIVKRKKDITKLESKNLIDKGGVLNGSKTKNEA